MYMQLEDEFGDIIGKARRGRELSMADLAEQSNVSEDAIVQMEAYELTPDDDTIRTLAAVLGLDPGKLQASAARGFFPLYPNGRVVDGLVVEMMVLGTDFLMNGYVVGCTETRQGAIVDPGFDAEKILRTVESTGLEIQSVLLTHGHGDHVGALSEICQATGAPALICGNDIPLLGGLRTKVEGTIEDGETISVGKADFMARLTPGHTEGGLSLIHDEAVFVGDALFAGSLGGTRNRADYDRQRVAVEEHLLSLDQSAILYPGHGPATTVGEEQLNNPFYSG
jgi:glyoxylase-like metal-dependent hydrolase (beta-lactamase superfamily II)